MERGGEWKGVSDRVLWMERETGEAQPAAAGVAGDSPPGFVCVRTR